jgi:hypothetical protein
MAGLWSCSLAAGARALLRSAMPRAALALTMLALGACTELARPNEVAPQGTEPPYVSIAAQYLRGVLLDRAAYDGFAISPLRWVHSLRGWTWLACVHFQDHGHLRSYALFLDSSRVVDARYAVETDDCARQTYTEFDLLSGVIGRPTAPVQEPIY